MYIVAIDDMPLEALGIPPALLTDRSGDLAFTVRRREGSRASLFIGGAPEPAVWNILFRPPDEDARALLFALLTSRLDEPRRLVAVRTDPEGTEVTTTAAISEIIRRNEFDLEVELESVDSIWTMERAVSSAKSFTSPRDLALPVAVPGATRSTPTITLTPLAQRSSGTAAVGSRYRTRWRITNLSDEPLWRYPVRLSLGDTTALVSGGKALASGNDVGLWLDGLEQSRTLVTWNSATSFLWFILPVLLPQESLVVDVVYGNLQAGAPPLLAYPDLPPFTLASSSNASWAYPVDPTAANGGLGVWALSKATEGATADFTVPGAWRPLATLGNPDNTDAVAQLRASQYVASGTKYQGVLDALRSVEDSTVVLATNPFDGVGLHHPLGIVSLTANFRWINIAGVGAAVILARDSAAEGWERLYTNTGVAAAEVAIASATYTPGAPVRHLACAVWPANLVALAPASDPAAYARLRWQTTCTLALDSSKLVIAQVLDDPHPWTPADLGGSLRGWFQGTAIAGVAPNGPVALWPDSSGAARHATQASAAQQPTYQPALLNGLPGVDFAGAQQVITALPAGDIGETLAAVVIVDAVPTVATLVGSGASSGRLWEITTARTPRFSRVGQGIKASSTLAVTLDVPAVVTGMLGVATSVFTVNGTAETVATAGQSGASGITSLIGSGYDGAVLELVSAGLLDVPTRQRLEGYLANRYGIAASLAAGHPYLAAAPTVAAAAEIPVYEVATEVRLGGGGANRVAPYSSLLVGNARGATGAGTPRAAVRLTEAVLIDGEARSHGVWPATLTTKVEDLSAHAVRAIVGWDDSGVAVEGYTSEWLPLLPSLPHPPASAFDAGLEGWAVEQQTAGLTLATSWDSAVGGDVLGSLRASVTANIAGSGAQAVVMGPRYLPVGGREAVTVAAWQRTSSVNLVPRLLLRFLDRDRAVLTDILEPLWVPVADESVRRPLAARVPERAAFWRYGLLLYAVTAGATGTVWLDDVRPNATDLVLIDQALGELGVSVAVRGRWVW